MNDTWYEVEVGDLSRSPVSVHVDGEEYLVEVGHEGAEPSVASAGPAQTAAPPPPPPPTSRPQPQPATLPPPAPTAPAPAVTPGAIRAPMPGVIVQVLVAPGEAVSLGQDLCILEAMKMQQHLKATQDGVVRQVLVETGQRVSVGQTLIEIDPAG